MGRSEMDEESTATTLKSIRREHADRRLENLLEEAAADTVLDPSEAVGRRIVAILDLVCMQVRSLQVSVTSPSVQAALLGMGEGGELLAAAMGRLESSLRAVQAEQREILHAANISSEEREGLEGRVALLEERLRQGVRGAG